MYLLTIYMKNSYILFSVDASNAVVYFSLNNTTPLNNTTSLLFTDLYCSQYCLHCFVFIEWTFILLHTTMFICSKKYKMAVSVILFHLLWCLERVI